MDGSGCGAATFEHANVRGSSVNIWFFIVWVVSTCQLVGLFETHINPDQPDNRFQL